MTPSQKAQLTKEINAYWELIKDLFNECTTQTRQPNGHIYLHGEIITVRRINDAIHNHNTLIDQRGKGGKFSPINQLPKKSS